MNSSTWNRFYLIVGLTIILLCAITANALSQRRSEISSVSSALLLHSESNDNIVFLQYGTTMSIDSGRSTGVNRGLIIAEKVGLGGLLGASFMLPGALIGNIISRKKDDAWSGLTGVLIGGYIGYVFGSSYGVHLISKNENPESNYGLTLLSGCIGVGIGGAISAITHNGKVGTSLAFTVPIVFPIMYTELIE